MPLSAFLTRAGNRLSPLFLMLPGRKRPVEGATIQGFWSGPPLSDIHWACLRSFLSCGHEFTLYSYGPLAVPAGVRVADASSIVPEQDVFYYQNNLTALPDIGPFSDYFRLKLLHEMGGWYCDVDTVCLSSHLPVASRVWASQDARMTGDVVSNGQLFFEKDDPLLRTLIDKCLDVIPNLPRRETLGPRLLTSTLEEMGLPRDMSASAEAFYPIKWVEVFKLWLPEFTDEVEARTKRSMFVPLYQSFPLYVGFDSHKHPPKGSYLSKLLDGFVPELLGPTNDAGEVRRVTGQWLRSNPWAVEWLESIGCPDAWRALLKA